MQIAEVTWKHRNDDSFEAGLTVWRGNDQEPAFLPLPPGRQISWLVRGPKRCIGSVNAAGKLECCPENSIILSSGQKCGPCQAMDLIDPCIRCDGRRCDAVEARRLQCESTVYYVYAVIFNDKTLKVGVSSKGRTLTRWVEQGADYAAVLREIEGGRIARRLEDRISRLHRITKQVRSERKTKALVDRLEPAEAQSILDNFTHEASHLDLNSSVDLVNLSRYYHLKELTSQPLAWRSRSEPIDGKVIFGENMGLKGSLMVTRVDATFTAVNLKQIIGYTIDLDSDITLVTQTGLIDFF